MEAGHHREPQRHYTKDKYIGVGRAQQVERDTAKEQIVESRRVLGSESCLSASLVGSA